MSVPSYRRAENKFEVLNIAMEIFKLSMTIVKNEEIVPKKNFKIIADPLLNTIRTLMYKISIANNQYVKSKEQLEYRLQLQEEIKDIIIMFTVDIQLAMYLSTSTKSLIKFESLLQKVDELKAKLRGWTTLTKQLLKDIEKAKDFHL